MCVMIITIKIVICVHIYVGENYPWVYYISSRGTLLRLCVPSKLTSTEK